MRSDEIGWSGFMSAIMYLSMFSLGLWKLGEIVIWSLKNIQIWSR